MYIQVEWGKGEHGCLDLDQNENGTKLMDGRWLARRHQRGISSLMLGQNATSGGSVPLGAQQIHCACPNPGRGKAIWPYNGF